MYFLSSVIVVGKYLKRLHAFHYFRNHCYQYFHCHTPPCPLFQLSINPPCYSLIWRTLWTSTTWINYQHKTIFFSLFKNIIKFKISSRRNSQLSLLLQKFIFLFYIQNIALSYQSTFSPNN